MRISFPRTEDIPKLKELWKEAFGDTDSFIDLFFSIAYSPDRCRCSFDGDIPVSVLYWFDSTCRGEKIAYIYAVATRKEYRGRGHSSSLIKDTHDLLRSEGYVGALLVPVNEGLVDFYSRLGYERRTTVKELEALPYGDAFIREIDSLEYANLRRGYLPEGSVIQEGISLEFLSKQLKFYTGDGFLLAAGIHRGVLEAKEFLGEVTLTPAIVNSLGCKKGIFRTVGDGRDYSMFIGLTENATPPEYFGFAFD